MGNDAVASKLCTDGEGLGQLSLDNSTELKQDCLDVLVFLLLDGLLETVPAPEELMERRPEDEIFHLRHNTIETLEDVEEDGASAGVADLDRMNQHLGPLFARHDAAAKDKGVRIIFFLENVEFCVWWYFIDPVDTALTLARPFVEILDDTNSILISEASIIFYTNGIGEALND